MPRNTLLSFLFAFLFLSLHPRAGAQKPGEVSCLSPSGSVIINEVGNIAEKEQGDQAGEFIELVVIGENPLVPVDLRGFIIDDNHSPFVVNGSTPGHIRLGKCFVGLMPGTVILLYDNLRPFPGIHPANDGMPNADGVYQIPFSSNCIDKYAACPTDKYASYNCAPGGIPGAKDPDWRNYLHLNDEVDVVQVRNPSEALVHALMWWPKVETTYGEAPKSEAPFPNATHPNAVKVTDQSVGGKDI